MLPRLNFHNEQDWRDHFGVLRAECGQLEAKINLAGGTAPTRPQETKDIIADTEALDSHRCQLHGVLAVAEHVRSKPKTTIEIEQEAAQAAMAENITLKAENAKL